MFWFGFYILLKLWQPMHWVTLISHPLSSFQALAFSGVEGKQSFEHCPVYLSSFLVLCILYFDHKHLYNYRNPLVYLNSTCMVVCLSSSWNLIVFVTSMLFWTLLSGFWFVASPMYLGVPYFFYFELVNSV